MRNQFSALLVLNILIFLNSNLQASTSTQIAVGNYKGGDSLFHYFMLINKDKKWVPHPIDTIGTPFNSKGYATGASCFDTNCVTIGGIDKNGASYNRIPVIYNSIDNGDHWKQSTIIGLPAIYDGFLEKMNCANNICVAVGGYNFGGEDTYFSLLSHDRGNSWSAQNILTPPHFILKDMAHINNTYIIAGYTNDDIPQLTFFLSQDEGKSWQPAQKIIGVPTMRLAELTRLSCNATTCVAAGHYDDHDGDGIPGRGEAHVLLLVSQDRGQTWSVIKDTLDLSRFTDAYIEDLTNNNGSFIAVGRYSDSLHQRHPLILTSKDNGNSWALIKNIAAPDKSDFGDLNSISCTQHTCITGGRIGYYGKSNSQITLLASHDDGQSWALVPKLPKVDFDQYHNVDIVNCFENHCSVLGHYSDEVEHEYSWIMESSDQGNSWFSSVIGDLPEHTNRISEVALTNTTKT